MDEVNLLADHLVDVLLDAAASGINVVQREGVEVIHPARFLLIGTMNPEEGLLRPQLLDRFGLMVEVVGPRDPELRIEVVREASCIRREPSGVRRRLESEQQALRSDRGGTSAAFRRGCPRRDAADNQPDLLSGWHSGDAGRRHLVQVGPCSGGLGRETRASPQTTCTERRNWCSHIAAGQATLLDRGEKISSRALWGGPGTREMRQASPDPTARFEPNASSPEKDRAESGDETGPEAPSGRVAANTIFRAAASGAVLPIRIAAAQAEEAAARPPQPIGPERTGAMFGPFLTPIRPSSLSMRRSVLPRPVVSTRRDESTFSGPIGIAKSGRAVRTP